MSDLIKEANFLRFYHTSDDAVKDKDFLKDVEFKSYTTKTTTLMMVPLALQVWQINLANNAEKLALYNKVRIFKSGAFAGAICLGLWELTNLRKKWTYYDRFYPEPTQLQKKLQQEAMMFKESNYEENGIQEKLAAVEDFELRQKYKQMYMLKPQPYLEPERADDVNSEGH